MSKYTIIGIIMIAVAILILTTASKDVSTYATFASAQNAGGSVKLIGELDLSQDMVYNPEENPNLFKFFLKDEEGTVKQIILSQPKPQDFERAESIVLTGEMKEDVFVASEMLTKCPSKYKDEELELKEG